MIIISELYVAEKLTMHDIQIELRFFVLKIGKLTKAAQISQ